MWMQMCIAAYSAHLKLGLALDKHQSSFVGMLARGTQCGVDVGLEQAAFRVRTRTQFVDQSTE
jgi:hypothetical protein